MIVRPATGGDVPALQAIYAHHVQHGTGTFEEVPPSAAEMADRLAAIQDQGFPWLVADGGPNGIAGYAYAGSFRTRSAYRFTAETSVYVAAGRERSGVGRALLEPVLEACQARGVRQMLALIGDSENLGSIRLHAALGFTQVGLLHAVGFKAGRWLDVVIMQKALDAQEP